MFQSIQQVIYELSQGILPRVIRSKGKHGSRLAQTLTNTAISTAGDGTLTAAALAGGLITRTGPSGAYADTTATAAQLLAVFPSAEVGDTFEFTIINGVAQACTFTAGTGITNAGTVNLAASAVRRYLATFTNVTPGAEAVTIRGISAGTA